MKQSKSETTNSSKRILEPHRHSCNSIEVLMHYYWSPEIHLNFLAPAVHTTIERYLDDGIFTFTEMGNIQLTDKGIEWLTRILNVPIPSELEMKEISMISNKRSLRRACEELIKLNEEI